jgi:N-acetylneuraminic acid mutarotase
VFTDGTRITIAAGLATGDVSAAGVFRLDPSTGSVVKVGALRLAVHDAGGAALGGAAHVFGGGGTTTVATVQHIGSGGTVTESQLPSPRSDSAVVTDGATAYIVGGFDGHAMDADILATTDGSTFTRVGALIQPVRYPAVAAFGGSIWVFGGQLSTAESSKSGGQSDDVQRFDPKTGRTDVVGHLPTSLGHAMAFSLGGSLFVVGVQVRAQPSTEMYRVDESGKATSVGSLPGPRSDAGVAVVGGMAWLIGGETTDPAHPLASVVELTARQ